MLQRKPHLLVLNQYYWPGVEATAQLLTELCESLSSDWDVRVVTGVLHMHEHDARHVVRHDVDIHRVRSTAFERSRMVARASNYATYLAGSFVEALAGPRPDIVLCMTDPPMIGSVGLAVARRFSAPLVVVSQDVFPDTAIRLGRLSDGVLAALMRMLIRGYLRRADRVVAIGSTMRRRLVAKGALPRRVTVIRNWVDTERITPQPRRNEWSREHALDDKFVVMHSGNVGHAQDLDTLVRAAPLLHDLTDLEIVILGFGARHAETVALTKQLAARNVRFLPYQPREALPSSLASADVHAVGLARGLAGLVVPSRINGVLAAARPVIVHADEESEVAALVREAKCGLVVPPGEPERLAQAIREAYDARSVLPTLGAAGRRWVVANGSRENAVAQYNAVLHHVAGLHYEDGRGQGAPSSSGGWARSEGTPDPVAISPEAPLVARGLGSS